MTVASSPLNTASMSCMSAGSRSACWPCSMPAECRDREEERPEGGWAMGAEKRDKGEGPEADGTMGRIGAWAKVCEAGLYLINPLARES